MKVKMEIAFAFKPPKTETACETDDPLAMFSARLPLFAENNDAFYLAANDGGLALWLRELALRLPNNRRISSAHLLRDYLSQDPTRDNDPSFATRLAKVRLKKLFFGDSFNTNFNPQGVTLIRHNNIVTCRYVTP